MTRRSVILAGISKTNNKQNLLAFSLAFFFLLALADQFRFGRLFTFSRRHWLNLFPHDTDGRDHELGIGQDLDTFADLDVRNVKRVVHVEIRNIDVQHVGNVARLATDLDLAKDLFEHALLFFYAERFANKVERHRDFDLLALHQPSQIGVHEPSFDRIDLAIVKHHFALTEAIDVDREDRISPGFRTQDRGQLAQRSNSSDRFPAASINRNRNHSLAACASRIVFAAALALFCLDPENFFLRHDFSLQTFSDPRQLPQVADGLRLSHQCLPFAKRRARKPKSPRGSTWSPSPGAARYFVPLFFLNRTHRCAGETE